MVHGKSSCAQHIKSFYLCGHQESAAQLECGHRKNSKFHWDKTAAHSLMAVPLPRVAKCTSQSQVCKVPSNTGLKKSVCVREIPSIQKPSSQSVSLADGKAL